MNDFAASWLAQCPLNPDITYLNSGTLGPPLKVVAETVDGMRKRWIENGPGAAVGIPGADGYLEMMRWTDRARRSVAAWMKTSPQSVAITGNATDAINMALTSIVWHSGDHIVTTSDEHAALTFPLRLLEKRYNVTVDVVDFPLEGSEDQLIDSLRTTVKETTRMVAMSSVSHQSGVALDLSYVLENIPFYSGWVLIDGSHAAGTHTALLTPRVDFYVFPCHKWLFGPIGTGVLWVGPRALEETDGILWGAPMIRENGERYLDREGAWRYEFGTRDWAVAAGIVAAIEFRQRWTEEEIIEHYRNLSLSYRAGHSKAGCAATLTGTGPVLRIQTPGAANIARDLWTKHRVIVKPEERAMRISLPPWLTPRQAEDIGYCIGRELMAVGDKG
ncbi:MAG: aminotransferase class V-fold PLP-dependent enzyme [Firmicutes bacterium]|nr:aminotransferase class V-fold PLP-dependent enzyme [Bacillota bacterium]